MKTTSYTSRASFVALVLAVTTMSSTSFEIHTEELISHSILARLILESPVRRATRQKSGMAFLADKAIEPQVAFLSERDTTAGTKDKEQSTSVEVEEGQSQHVPPAFGLVVKHEESL